MRHKTPMGFDVPPGSVILGYHLRERKLADGSTETRKVGDTIELLGKPFKTAYILPELGTEKDSTIAIHLSDVAIAAEKPGKVNMILALDCAVPRPTCPRSGPSWPTPFPPTRRSWWFAIRREP